VIAAIAASVRELLILNQMEPDRILENWQSMSMTLGKRVRVRLEGKVLEGTDLGLSEIGELMVELPEGSIRRLLDCLELRLA
jgi:biotin-(acetyl-CoA carboxylase) ligase